MSLCSRPLSKAAVTCFSRAVTFVYFLKMKPSKRGEQWRTHSWEGPQKTKTSVCYRRSMFISSFCLDPWLRAMDQVQVSLVLVRDTSTGRGCVQVSQRRRKARICISHVQVLRCDLCSSKLYFLTFRAADWTNGTEHNGLQRINVWNGFLICVISECSGTKWMCGSAKEEKLEL